MATSEMWGRLPTWLSIPGRLATCPTFPDRAVAAAACIERPAGCSGRETQATIEKSAYNEGRFRNSCAENGMKIVHNPHPALRHAAKAVCSIDKKLHLHIGEMMGLMYEAKGLGLAAPQVALPFQLLVMNVNGDPAKPECEEVFLNPNIVERRGIIDDEEGCLSFPGLYQKIRRAKTIKIHPYDLKGQPVER